MKKDTADTVETTDAPAPALCCYEVTMPGKAPLKIGGALCYNTARVKLTKEQADALVANLPGCLKFLGI